MKLKLISILLLCICCNGTFNPVDCNGVPGGTAVIDECGVCGGNNSSMDECGVCGGNGSPCLDFSIESTQSTVTIDDTLIVTANVEHAEDLYALSFKLEYNSGNFEHINSGTVSIDDCDLFSESFLPYDSAFNQDGEINIVIGEMGSILSTTSGCACIIKLKAIGPGVSLIEITDLNMIQSDGAPIENISTVSVNQLSITVQ